MTPLTEDEFKRMCLTGLLVFIGAAVALAFVALGAALAENSRPIESKEGCAARYLGEIAYWAEAPDNRMVCQRLDRNSMRERKCAGLDVHVER